MTELNLHLYKQRGSSHVVRVKAMYSSFRTSIEEICVDSGGREVDAVAARCMGIVLLL